eukprot:GHVT01022505.1.p1 GENE.GHVT01022505.1~~GHVT01022505.1.p1  ORF type:complete len:421 (-),score=82.23 GHVT01022505.1:321-1583(-)
MSRDYPDSAAVGPHQRRSTSLPKRGRGGGRRDVEDGATLYVSGVATSVDQKALRQLFEQCGDVVEARIVQNPVTKESRGFGFVTMQLAEEADAAIAKLDGADLGGKLIRIEHAKRSKPHESTPGMYRGPPGASVKYDKEGLLRDGFLPYWEVGAERAMMGLPGAMPGGMGPSAYDYAAYSSAGGFAAPHPMMPHFQLYHRPHGAEIPGAVHHGGHAHRAEVAAVSAQAQYHLPREDYEAAAASYAFGGASDPYSAYGAEAPPSSYSRGSSGGYAYRVGGGEYAGSGGGGGAAYISGAGSVGGSQRFEGVGGGSRYEEERRPHPSSGYGGYVERPAMRGGPAGVPPQAGGAPHHPLHYGPPTGAELSGRGAGAPAARRVRERSHSRARHTRSRSRAPAIVIHERASPPRQMPYHSNSRRHY